MKGATARGIQIRHRRIGFNPRAREGRDPLDQRAAYCSELVSIHAPVKGATRATAGDNVAWIRFNPRAREGRDVQRPSTLRTQNKFQSTRP